MDEPRHFRNVVVLWALASLIMTPIVVFVIGPGLPPGNGSVEASGQVTDNIVLLATATPVALAVLVYMAYAIWAFRERTPDVVVDGPAIRGNTSVQFWWLVVTTTLVLFLAGYGTIRLLADGSGGGQGPNPIAVPAADAGGKPLVVQVIAQQWEFLYRFPGYGGV
jgi:heme/copper-type cytochrome/quinol oxidase subunit 2